MQTTNHKPQNHKPQNRIPLYLSSYTTKLDQTQYETLFQPNQKIHANKIGTPTPQKKKSKIKIWFWTNSELNSTKFSMPPYFNLN